MSFAQSFDLRFFSEQVSGQKQFLQENNLNTYKIFYQQFFLTDNKLDIKKLDALLKKSYPNKNSGGMLVLDWEGKGMDVLTKQNNTKEFNFYVAQFKSALKYVKDLRPNVQVGFYALPFRQYWNINKSYYSKNEKLMSILSMQDFIAPSLYIFYPTERYKSSNKEYVDKNVSFALQIGEKLGKPVYPFIWQRVHPSNRQDGNKLVPIGFFSQTIKDILDTKYQGKGVKGLLWWHSENYSFQTKEKSAALKKEYRSVSNANDYQKKMFQSYYNSIKTYLK